MTRSVHALYKIEAGINGVLFVRTWCNERSDTLVDATTHWPSVGCPACLEALVKAGVYVREPDPPEKALPEGSVHGSDHDYAETTYDRDDNPIPPTCAYCGRTKENCKGRKPIPLQAFGKELARHPLWIWRPGMKALGRRGSPTAWFRVEETVRHLTGDWREAIPDLTDEATVGILTLWLARLCDGRGGLPPIPWNEANGGAEHIAEALLELWNARTGR